MSFKGGHRTKRPDLHRQVSKVAALGVLQKHLSQTHPPLTPGALGYPWHVPGVPEQRAAGQTSQAGFGASDRGVMVHKVLARLEKGDPGFLLTKTPPPAREGWGALDQFPKPQTFPGAHPPRKAPAQPRAPAGRWCQPRCRRCRRRATTLGGPLSSLRRDPPVSPPPDSGPGEERVAPTVELRGLRRLPGPCAAPGQVEAEPAKVNGECPGIRRGGGPGCTVASASENFLGTASLGRSSPSRQALATGGWGGDGASPPLVRNRQTKGLAVRARASVLKKKKTPKERASRLSSPSPPKAPRSTPLWGGENVPAFQPSRDAATIRH